MVGLGWTVDKLYRLLAEMTQPNPAQAPSIDDMTPPLSLNTFDLFQIALWQVEVICSPFKSGITLSEVFKRRVELQESFIAFKGSGDSIGALQASGLPSNVQSLDKALSMTLSGTDYRLEKAYQLGRSLADFYRSRTGPQLQEASCAPASMSAGESLIITSALADLQCLLPKNSAAVVLASLRLTNDALAQASLSGTPDANYDAASLCLQGHHWRAMLTGETPAVSGLSGTADYLQAARILLGNFRDLLRHSIKLFRLPLGLLTVLALCGVASSVVLGSISHSDGTGILGAIASIVAALFAGGKIVSPSMIRVSEKAGPVLWEQAVVQVVAQSLPVERSIIGTKDHRRPPSVARL